MRAASHNFKTFAGYLLVASFILTACATEPPLTKVEMNETETFPALSTIGTQAATSAPSPETSAISDLNILQNTTYQLDIIDDAIPQSGGGVTLYNGVFEQKIPNSSERIKVQYIDGKEGDLNRDGIDDALALVAVSTGGSGTFIYLVAFLSQDGELHQAAYKMMGDRVKVNSIDIIDGKISLKLLEHGPNDGLCCPSQDAERVLLLTPDQLLSEKQAQVKPYADQAIQALQNQDWETLAAMVHPDDGVRFSPYGNIKESDLIFQPDELIELPASQTSYTWGAWDGSGEPIDMTFPEYFKRFIYSDEFVEADQVGYDQVIGTGNTLINTQEFYPEDTFVEYYLAGKDPQYGGLDWRSLRLVFRPDGETWRLVGIIHDEWTI